MGITSDGSQWLSDLDQMIKDLVVSIVPDNFNGIDSTIYGKPKIIVQVSIDKYGKTSCDTIVDKYSILDSKSKHRLVKQLSALTFSEVQISEHYLFSLTEKEKIEKFSPFRYLIPVPILPK